MLSNTSNEKPIFIYKKFARRETEKRDQTSLLINGEKHFSEIEYKTPLAEIKKNTNKHTSEKASTTTRSFGPWDAGICSLRLGCHAVKTRLISQNL